MGVRDPVGVRGPRLFWLSVSFSGTRGVTGPFPSKGRVRGVDRVRRASDREGLSTQAVSAWSRITTRLSPRHSNTSRTRGDTGPIPEREAGPGPLVW